MTATRLPDSADPSALPTFFSDDLGRAVTGGEVRLDPEEAGHARVRRLNVGERVALIDGGGGRWLGALSEVGRDGARCRLDEEVPGPSAPRVRVCAPVGHVREPAGVGGDR